MTEARARELVYALYQRGLHPELLPAAKSARVDRKPFRARLVLLERSGHSVAFTAGDAALVEAVIPAALEVPRTGRVELRSLGRGARERVKARGPVLYESAFALETCAATEFARRHRKILEAAPVGERFLLERGHPENEGPGPFSLVDYEVKDRGLDAFAVHAFPRERTFVFVQSSFAAAP